MATHDLQNRFTFHPATEAQGDLYATIRSNALDFANLIDAMAPDGREKALAVTKIEEAVFWANAAIARQGAAL